MTKISVVTLVHGRRHALKNLIAGLNACSQLPDELVVVHMNEAPYALDDTRFPLKHFELRAAHQLPLAQARNKGVQSAAFNHIVFLDVDCIPEPDLFARYQAAFEEPDVLWSGQVRYLSEEATAHTDLLERLWDYSRPDPVRAELQQYSYELFWSLNFGCNREIFRRIGGFDEAFKGYGAEDTDFSFSARQQGVALKTLSATAYHQYHPSYDPPLNHLDDIILNAQLFREKWGLWPMEGWLKKFVAMGYIHMDTGKIEKLKSAGQAEIKACLRI